MSYLILVRHGESRWNLQNLFTGWVDIPLSKGGIVEAQQAAEKLSHIKLEIAFTSTLERAQETLLLILAAQQTTGIFLHESGKLKQWSKHSLEFEKHWLPVHVSEAINERYYGELQGLNKDFARKKWGKEKVFEWRRSYNTKPPKGESLKDVVARSVPYFKKNIMPYVEAGKNVIVSAHGNSLRAIIKHIDNISEEEISHLELPTGKPIIYKYTNGKLKLDNHQHEHTRLLNGKNNLS